MSGEEQWHLHRIVQEGKSQIVLKNIALGNARCQAQLLAGWSVVVAAVLTVLLVRANLAWSVQLVMGLVAGGCVIVALVKIYALWPKPPEKWFTSVQPEDLQKPPYTAGDLCLKDRAQQLQDALMTSERAIARLTHARARVIQVFTVTVICIVTVLMVQAAAVAVEMVRM